MADLVKQLDYFVNCTLLSRAKGRSVKEKTLLPPRNHNSHGKPCWRLVHSRSNVSVFSDTSSTKYDYHPMNKEVR